MYSRCTCRYLKPESTKAILIATKEMIDVDSDLNVPIHC